MRFLIFMLLTSCATIHKTEGEQPPVVTYFGTAQGATDIIDAQRSFDLAHTAMDKGLPVSLTKTDEFVGFTAGNSYVTGPGIGGYAPADVVSTQNGWYVPTGQGSSLPKLGTQVVENPSLNNTIVPCPKGVRQTPAEQAACAEVDASLAIAHIKELESK